MHCAGRAQIGAFSEGITTVGSCQKDCDAEGCLSIHRRLMVRSRIEMAGLPTILSLVHGFQALGPAEQPTNRGRAATGPGPTEQTKSLLSGNVG